MSKGRDPPPTPFWNMSPAHKQLEGARSHGHSQLWILSQQDRRNSHTPRRDTQHCQPLVDARFHTGPRLQCQRCEREPSENSTSVFLPEEPSNPQLSAASTTQSFKIGPWLPPAAFSSLFAELLLCTLILQPPPFLPQHHQFFCSSVLHRLLNCAFSLDCWKSGITRMQHQHQAPAHPADVTATTSQPADCSWCSMSQRRC